MYDVPFRYVFSLLEWTISNNPISFQLKCVRRFMSSRIVLISVARYLFQKANKNILCPFRIEMFAIL